MRLKMFAIRDLLGEVYAAPFCRTNRGLAIRFCRELMENPQATCRKSPKDFALYEVGFYDDLTGRVEALEVVSLVNHFTDFEISEVAQ